MLSKMNKNEWGLLLGLLFMWGCDSESAGKDTTELLTGKIENVVEPTTAISTDGKDAAIVVFTANKAWNVRTEKTGAKRHLHLEKKGKA